MILTNAQISTLQRVKAACNQVLPRIEMLEQLGHLNATIGQRAAELRAQREYQFQLAESALEIDRQVGSNGK